MKKLLISFILIPVFFIQADLIKDYTKNKKVIVVHGERAPEKEVKIAQTIHKLLELDQMDTNYDHIINDTYFMRNKFFYADFHLIIVGTPESNLLCKVNAEIQISSPWKNNSKMKLLTESEQGLASWKQKLGSALGQNGQIIVDVIPDIELILGKQPDLPELPPSEALNRFIFREMQSLWLANW